ncbi:MAG TPA: rhodanese-like domain-containing protein [Blastocatellia bacterium]|nr:rhodanese-like domain-containing protein [Blastocatellia bacterium]
MSFREWAILVCVFFLSIGAGATTAGVGAAGLQDPAQAKPDQAKPPEVEWMTVEELKAKLAKNEAVTIVDLRAMDSFEQSSDKIKGAIHMKARRLRYRLSFAPFRELPRDREIVTYCACPSDEIAVRAVQVIKEAGFKRVRVLKGGWHAWLKAGGPVESKPKV